MSLSISNIDSNLLFTLLSRNKPTKFQPSAPSFNFLDTWSGMGNTVLEIAVRKMQDAINHPIKLVNGQSFSGISQSTSMRSFNISGSVTVTGGASFTPTKEQVASALAEAGGKDALSQWLVDGQTKISVDGKTVVARVDSYTGSAASTDDAKADAAKALAKFGFGAERLDGDLNSLRADLRSAADAAGRGNSATALAVEYALEDAFSKIRAVEDANGGKNAFEQQKATNQEQADSIMRQLNLGSGSAWAMSSAAEDLAAFGFDLTALADQGALKENLEKAYNDKLAELKTRYVGTETDYYAETRRYSGAYARLSNSVGVGSLTASLASQYGSVKVTVGGVEIDASSVVSVVNVIADPLVFDLNGDGIDLKSAEEGVEFDLNGDGEKKQTGFIRGDDALLFLDETGEGVVKDGRQLFGNSDGYANGFEKLKAYDENGDGVIDENDSVYHQLRLWVEKNEDGICEADETMSLAEAGIKSIRVDYENTREDDGKGNLVGQKGSFTRTDGSEGYAADVWLRELASRP